MQAGNRLSLSDAARGQQAGRQARRSLRGVRHGCQRASGRLTRSLHSLEQTKSTGAGCAPSREPSLPNERRSCCRTPLLPAWITDELRGLTDAGRDVRETETLDSARDTLRALQTHSGAPGERRVVPAVACTRVCCYCARGVRWGALPPFWRDPCTSEPRARARAACPATSSHDRRRRQRVAAAAGGVGRRSGANGRVGCRTACLA